MAEICLKQQLLFSYTVELYFSTGAWGWGGGGDGVGGCRAAFLQCSDMLCIVVLNRGGVGTCCGGQANRMACNWPWRSPGRQGLNLLEFSLYASDYSGQPVSCSHTAHEVCYSSVITAPLCAAAKLWSGMNTCLSQIDWVLHR